MATPAVAQETLLALRRQIAKIEGTLAERLVPAADDSVADGLLLRRHGRGFAPNPPLSTGVPDFDAALGGGVPCAALTEIHGAQTRDAGAVVGFCLALAAMARGAAPAALPLLWIGTSDIVSEAGFPYAPGIASSFGLDPGDLLLAEAGKTLDALWIAEEAAPLSSFCAVVLELRGTPSRLDLVATRRLHVRAQQAGRPVFLLRQANFSGLEPTAAPLRLVVGPAPAASRWTVAGPLAGSIGPPGFSVTVSKSRSPTTGLFILEWNADERSFHQRHQDADAADPRAVVPLSKHRADPAAAPGAVVALHAGAGIGGSADGRQPSRSQHAAHQGPRRAR